MLMKYNNTVNGLGLTYNGEAISGSGLLSHEVDHGGDLLSWCVGPLDNLQRGWVEYTPANVSPSTREAQVGWIIQNQGWASIEDMSGADQDTLGLILNEAWLEDQANELDLASGTSVITGVYAPTATSWIESSQGMASNGVNISILVDSLGQSQATWELIPLPPTAALLLAGAVIYAAVMYLEKKCD